MKNDILSRLQTKCSFPEVFEEKEKVEGCSFPEPLRKIGHIRADYDGCRWYNTVWPCHRELTTPESRNEIDRVYEALTSKNALKDLNTLRRFCASHMDACMCEEYHDEFSFYLEGEVCNYWVRLITRRGDYNLYLNAYTRGEVHESLSDH